MGIYKRVLVAIVILLSVFLVSACSTKKENEDLTSKFPLDKKGYPRTDSVIINGNVYNIKDLFLEESKVKNEINIKVDQEKNEFELILPMGTSINQWSIEKKDILLNEYKRISLSVKDELEGVSPYLQVFKFTSDAKEIRLKYHNINELDKAFDEKDHHCMIILNVSYE